MLETYWVLILFPLAGATLNGILGRRLSPSAVAGIACSACGLSFLMAVAALLELLELPSSRRSVAAHLFTWIRSGDLTAEFSFLLDPLSMLMILLVTGVGFLIHVYSITYMSGEQGFHRYFAYLNLFIFMMSVLVLADNYLLMFVGWEGVGLCSYLLIGFYVERKAAGDAAKKAFIVNRIGDVGFLLGVFLIFATFGTFEYRAVFEQTAARFPDAVAGWGLLAAITLFLLVGATGKSAQIPLYVWLPDAMEGPTPVSALIHAATMVTAGVYMMARSAPLYSRAPDVLFLIACVGATTAILAALIALTQRDIKRVLAYSTVSQLGYMFLAVGVGAFGAGVFHLATHGFFKALLFLGSGSVILALHHEQDLTRMGALRTHLPVTCATMWIGTLAISGVPLFSGFFSKDQILWEAFSSPQGSVFFWFLGLAVAGLTAFYMSRLMFLTFHGASRATPSESHHAPQEPNMAVKVPLIILAFFSVVAGYLGLPAYLAASNRLQDFLEPSFRLVARPLAAAQHGHAEELLLTAITVAVAAAGIAAAYWMYLRSPESPERLRRRFPGTARLLSEKLYVDQIYDRLVVHPLERVSRGFLWKTVDIKIIDGLVHGVARFCQGCGQLMRRFQSGQARAYAEWILAGALLIVLYLYLAGS